MKSLKVVKKIGLELLDTTIFETHVNANCMLQRVPPNRSVIHARQQAVMLSDFEV